MSLSNKSSSKTAALDIEGGVFALMKNEMFEMMKKVMTQDTIDLLKEFGVKDPESYIKSEPNLKTANAALMETMKPFPKPSLGGPAKPSKLFSKVHVGSYADYYNFSDLALSEIFEPYPGCYERPIQKPLFDIPPPEKTTHWIVEVQFASGKWGAAKGFSRLSRHLFKGYRSHRAAYRAMARARKQRPDIDFRVRKCDTIKESHPFYGKGLIHPFLIDDVPQAADGDIGDWSETDKQAFGG